MPIIYKRNCNNCGKYYKGVNAPKFCSTKCAGVACSKRLKGCSLSAKIKSKISNTLTGRKLSEKTKQKMRKARSNEIKHYKWKGNGVGKSGVHDWVRKHKGKPKICIHCGKKRTKVRGSIHWANIDHKYRRKLSDYISLCPRCHKKHDLKNKLCKH